MSTVPKTKENVKKCMCTKCPSYTLICKVKSVPDKVSVNFSHLEFKSHAEVMFCAYEPSRCIEKEKGCLCESCELFREYELEKSFFCIIAGGKQ